MAVQPTHKRLSNGLQSLSEASPDYELAPVGIASMHDQAQRLAEYGRNGDVYVIHAAEGETVIPMEVLDANPQIKQLLFAQMKDMGLDPQEFVVGNELNSINPVTGLPEFFFKSIFRAVKKAVKGVFKFAKKIAPVALPIAASLFFPGYPVLAGAIGGGLGSLAGGGSLKDAFKNAMISGGTAALWGGVKGLQSMKDAPPIGFMEGVEQAVTGVPGSPTMAEQWGRLTEGTLGGIEDFLYAAPTSEKTSAVGGPYAEVAKNAGYKPEEILWHSKDDLAETSLDTLRDYTPFAEPKLDEFRGAEALKIAKDRARTAEVIDYAKSIGKSIQDIPDIEKYQIGKAAADKVTAASLTSGPLKQWGPLGLASLGAGYAGGMCAPPEEEEEATAADLEFGLAGGVLEPNKLFAAEETAGTGTGGRNKFLIPVNPREFEENILKGQQVFAPSIFAADGGMIRGPGTGTSDSIPGWLSDGEFVFTEKAVRGADPTGQGRRQAGANNMYNIMRNFEMRA